MRVVLLDSAREDLIWFRRYYRLVFPEGRREGVRHFDKAVEALGDMPGLGRILDGGHREMAIARTPFSLVYRLRDNRIEVLRVWDLRADRAGDRGPGEKS